MASCAVHVSAYARTAQPSSCPTGDKHIRGISFRQALEAAWVTGKTGPGPYLELGKLGAKADGELLDMDVLQARSKEVASLMDGDDGCQDQAGLYCA